MAQKLFDKASLVMIPSQYKEGKIYNIKPEDQSSSFEFERGTAATRVNSSGLIEQTGVSSAELWHDDDILTSGTGSYADGVVTITASTGNDYVAFHSLDGVEAGNYYQLSFDVVANSGSFAVLQGTGNNFTPNYLISESGSYSRIVEYTHGAPNKILFYSNNSTAVGIQFDGTISNFSIKKVNIDTPRLDYSGTEPALLLEPQRANLFEDSQYLTGNIQTSTGGLLPERDSSVQTPDGLNNADKMVRAIAETRVYATVHKDITVSSGQPYSLSCYFKAGTSKYPALSFYLFDTSEECDIIFDLENETTHITRGNGTGKIENVGNGWYRCSLENVSTTTDLTGRIGVSMAQDATNFYWTLDANNNGLYYHAFGLQFEQGSYATSYIPTNGQVETRLADVCTGGGDASVFNDSEGTLYYEFSAFEDTINRTIVFKDENNDNNIFVRIGGNGYLYFFVHVGGTQIINRNWSGFEQTDNNKIAVRYSSSGYSVYVNGVERLTGTNSISFTNNINEIKISAFPSSFKMVNYFSEALTDTELQQLTSNT